MGSRGTVPREDWGVRNPLGFVSPRATACRVPSRACGLRLWAFVDFDFLTLSKFKNKRIRQCAWEKRARALFAGVWRGFLLIAAAMIDS